MTICLLGLSLQGAWADLSRLLICVTASYMWAQEVKPLRWCVSVCVLRAGLAVCKCVFMCPGERQVFKMKHLQRMAEQALHMPDPRSDELHFCSPTPCSWRGDLSLSLSLCIASPEDWSYFFIAATVFPCLAGSQKATADVGL